MYCPKCEEAYLPKHSSSNCDGAFYGSSFPYIFMNAFPAAVQLPPKVHFYEPKIYGFSIVGKRGSKYYKPEASAVKEVYDENGKTQEQKLLEEFKKNYQKQKQQTLNSARGGKKQKKK